jgi:hypothetical protein
MTNKLPAIQWDPGKHSFNQKLGNFVQYFQVNLPTNGSGIPLQLIDPTVISPQLLECETTDDVADAVVEEATLTVDLDEGIPAIDGLPIWERFDGEQLDYYKLFKEYREMLYISGSRAFVKVANNHNMEGKVISTLAKVYHWHHRCKAYDFHKRMEAERKRHFEREQLENKHSKTASTLLERGLEYLEAHPEQLNPKTALQMIEMGMKAGRLAMGMSPDKPGIGGESSGTNINIQQTAAISEPTEGSSITINNNVTKEDTDYLQSVVHILEQSGAFDKEPKIIEAEFSEAE